MRVTKTKFEQSSGSSPLQQDILKTILYFDIFRHPLSATEIYDFLPSDSTSVNEIRAACLRPPLADLLEEQDGFFYLVATRKEHSTLVSERRRNEIRAKRFLGIARLMSVVLRRFPFVRGLYISGELSKGVLSKDGDIDYVVVTAPHRVWITRTLLILFKKIFLLNKKKFLCINHLVAEDYVRVAEKNLYTALEIATLKPLVNRAFLSKYIQENSWITEFFPNIPPPPGSEHDTTSRSSLVQRFLEWPLRGNAGDKLDTTLMNLWRRIWQRRYPHLSFEKLGQLFRSEESISTAYAGDFLPQILSAYADRLRRFGLHRPFAIQPHD